MAGRTIGTLEKEIEGLQSELDEAQEENDELRETLIQISGLAEIGDDDEEDQDDGAET
jgi:prefoldin subunit 5